MSFVVFDTKANSIYKDEIERRYHFPLRYLDVASTAVGSWVLYREPRADGGRMAYFAAARVDRIESDPDLPNHFYAYVDKFTEFDRIVPWQSEAGTYREQWLRDLPQNQVGVQMRGRSVRVLEHQDFAVIVGAGLKTTLEELGSEMPPIEDQLVSERKLKTVLANQKVRERSFRRNVISAYAGTCAFTGLSIVDLNGKPEVEAAHIQSVGYGGPDISINGLALCRTAHWLFDRLLVGLSDNLGLLFDRRLLPPAVVALLEPQQDKIQLPNDSSCFPAPRFVRFHRELYEQRSNSIS